LKVRTFDMALVRIMIKIFTDKVAGMVCQQGSAFKDALSESFNGRGPICRHGVSA